MIRRTGKLLLLLTLGLCWQGTLTGRADTLLRKAVCRHDWGPYPGFLCGHWNAGYRGRSPLLTSRCRGCGEKYWHDGWTPWPDCHEPCNRCGQYVGSSYPGRSGGGPGSGYGCADPGILRPEPLVTPWGGHGGYSDGYYAGEPTPAGAPQVMDGPVPDPQFAGPAMGGGTGNGMGGRGWFGRSRGNMGGGYAYDGGAAMRGPYEMPYESESGAIGYGPRGFGPMGSGGSAHDYRMSGMGRMAWSRSAEATRMARQYGEQPSDDGPGRSGWGNRGRGMTPGGPSGMYAGRMSRSAGGWGPPTGDEMGGYGPDGSYAYQGMPGGYAGGYQSGVAGYGGGGYGGFGRGGNGLWGGASNFLNNFFAPQTPPGASATGMQPGMMAYGPNMPGNSMEPPVVWESSPTEPTPADRPQVARRSTRGRSPIARTTPSSSTRRQRTTAPPTMGDEPPMNAMVDGVPDGQGGYRIRNMPRPEDLPPEGIEVYRGPMRWEERGPQEMLAEEGSNAGSSTERMATRPQRSREAPQLERLPRSGGSRPYQWSPDRRRM